MRKLLLASAALVGASSAMGGFASAQPASIPAPVVTTPQMQTLTTANGGNSANSNNNYQAAMLPGSVANPTPGTMVVRFNGIVMTEFGVAGGSGFVGNGPTVVTTGGLGPGPGANGTSAFTGIGTNAGQKLATYSIGTYFRLYPGVDAMSANGLRYGAQAEIRENFISANASTSNLSSGLTSGQTLFVRRAFVYAAGDQWGLLRIGQTDGVTGIFDNGITTGTQAGQGLWNGDAPQMLAGQRGDLPMVLAAGRRVRQQQDRLPVAADRRLRLRLPLCAEQRQPGILRLRRAGRNSESVVVHHAAAGRPLQGHVRGRRALSGHVRAGGGLWLRRLSRQRPRQLRAAPRLPRSQRKAVRRLSRAASTMASSRASVPGSPAPPSPSPASPWRVHGRVGSTTASWRWSHRMAPARMPGSAASTILPGRSGSASPTTSSTRRARLD